MSLKNSISPSYVVVYKPNKFRKIKIKCEKIGYVTIDIWHYLPYFIFQLEGWANVTSYPIDIFNFEKILDVLCFYEILFEKTNCTKENLSIGWLFGGLV